MPKVTGPLFSQQCTGTIASAIIYTSKPPMGTRRAQTTRASPRLRFRTKRPAPVPSSAQTAQRSSLAAATAYAKSPPAPDVPAIEALARARNLPFFQAASAYYFATPHAPAGIAWDGGATTWDGGATTWSS